MRFDFYNGPWENSELPTITRDDPAGGDPHILAVIQRVHNPDALYELCRLANEAEKLRPEARPASGHTPLEEAVDTFLSAYRERFKKPTTIGVKAHAPLRAEAGVLAAALNAALHNAQPQTMPGSEAPLAISGQAPGAPSNPSTGAKP
jgi:hypothetical protein